MSFLLKVTAAVLHRTAPKVRSSRTWFQSYHLKFEKMSKIVFANPHSNSNSQIQKCKQLKLTIFEVT